MTSEFERRIRTHADPVMSFGKYKGSKVSTLPSDYLAWLVGEADVRSNELKQAIEREWRRRKPRNVDMVEREARVEPGAPEWWVFYHKDGVGHGAGYCSTGIEGPFSEAAAKQRAGESGGKVTGPWPSKKG